MALGTVALVASIAGITASAVTVAAAGLKLSKDIPAARRAKNAQENLERERRLALTSERSARESARQRAATAGSRVGTRTGFITGLGFGSGTTTTTQVGRGNLFGN